jgi:hypothetical protein
MYIPYGIDLDRHAGFAPLHRRDAALCTARANERRRLRLCATQSRIVEDYSSFTAKADQRASGCTSAPAAGSADRREK